MARHALEVERCGLAANLRVPEPSHPRVGVQHDAVERSAERFRGERMRATRGPSTRGMKMLRTPSRANTRSASGSNCGSWSITA